MWDCPVVRQFWLKVEGFLSNFSTGIIITKKIAIFGAIFDPVESFVNTVLMWSRHFIWKEKFKSKNLTEISFLNYIKSEVRHLIDILEGMRVPNKIIDYWAQIFQYFSLNYSHLYNFNDIMS